MLRRCGRSMRVSAENDASQTAVEQAIVDTAANKSYVHWKASFDYAKHREVWK